MLSVTIIVKNGERRLGQVLEALGTFDEVVVYDTGSTDRTEEIAASFSNVVFKEGPFEGFGPTHNKAAACAKHDWILSLDADEVLSEELAEEIVSTRLDKGTVYDLPFRNFYRGKWIRWCGWHPESHIRLYNRTVTSFSEALVHEGVQSEGLKVEKCEHPVFHYPYDSLSDFLVKMERYSALFATQYAHKRRSSPVIAAYHGAGAFLKSYVLKRGFLGGFAGFLISAYNGHTAFYKYLKLYEANATHTPLP